MTYAIFIVLIIFVCCLYYFIKRKFLYWESRNIPQIKPKSLIFGNSEDVILGRVTHTDYYKRVYNELAPHKFGGIFTFQKPVLVLRDPELIRHVLTKDFHLFTNRGSALEAKGQLLPTADIFQATGDHWKILRKKITPTFAPGKAKILFHMMTDKAAELRDVIEESEQRESIDITELATRYMIDGINFWITGLKANSLRGDDFKIRNMIHEISETRLITSIISIFPMFSRFLSKIMFPPKAHILMKNFVADLTFHRAKNHAPGDDIFEALMSLTREENISNQPHSVDTKEKLENFLAHHLISYYYAAVHSSSTVLTLTLFEVAKNSSVQKKLQEEIDLVFEKNDGQFTYELQRDFTYVDQVISEGLRMYPSLANVTRVCEKNYNLPNTDITIEKGTTFIIPIVGLHYDPHYFPQPNEFDPEHFSKEATDTREKYAYLPFGEGPRNCIGSRFGFMMIKVALISLIKCYNLSLCPNMPMRVELKKNSMEQSCNEHIRLNFVRRNV